MDSKKIVREIVKKFQQLDKRGNAPKSGTECTKMVLKALSRVGREKFNCIVRPRVGRGRGEWLWDLCWRRRDNSKSLKDIPLVAESEWGNLNKIREDFEKLLAARALVRVMVYDAKQPGKGRHTAEEIAEELRNRVKEFNGKRGDVYLLIAAEGRKNRWKYFQIIDQGMKRQPSLSQVSLQAKKNITWVAVRG